MHSGDPWGFLRFIKKKDGPLKKGKLMGDIWLGDVINMKFLNANEHRYIIDME